MMQVIASKDAEIEELKKRLKDATDIIKSRDDTISARDAQIAGLQNEIVDLKKRLAELNETYIFLKTEHGKLLDLIAALRRQIKETKDALELDNPKLIDIKDKVQAETAQRQKQLAARFKAAAVLLLSVEGPHLLLRARKTSVDGLFHQQPELVLVERDDADRLALIQQVLQFF